MRLTTVHFGGQRPNSRVPRIGLIPVVSILVAMLAFFVVISVNLAKRRVIGIQLPRSISKRSLNRGRIISIRTVIIKLSGSNGLIFRGAPVARTTLTSRMHACFARGPRKQLILGTSHRLSCQSITALLDRLHTVNNGQISLTMR